MNEAIVNQTLETLAKQFNVSVEYLVPRMQEYKVAMCSLGFWISVFFIAAALLLCVFFVHIIKKEEGSLDISDWMMVVFVFFVAEVLPVGFAITNAVEYVGWKHAPEMKLIDYILRALK